MATLAVGYAGGRKSGGLTMSNMTLIMGAFLFVLILTGSVILFSLLVFPIKKRRLHITFILFLNNTVLKLTSMSTTTVKKSQFKDDGTGCLVITGRIVPTDDSGA